MTFNTANLIELELLDRDRTWTACTRRLEEHPLYGRSRYPGGYMHHPTCPDGIPPPCSIPASYPRLEASHPGNNTVLEGLSPWE